MAQQKRAKRTALTGGKLALFEVLQAAQARGSSQLSDAVAQGAPTAATCESVTQAPPEPALVVQAQPVPTAPVTPPPQSLPLDQLFARRRSQDSSRSPGISVIGFATVVAGAIALAGAGLIAWGHYSRRTPHVVSSSTAMPEVLDVGGARASTPTLARPVEQTRTQAVSQGPVAAATVAPDFRRVNGLNYALVQSYASSEEALALATCQALLKNGVGATVERGIPGWPNRLCVVGTEGFEQVRSNTKYQAYRQRLMDISSLATAADKRLRKFDPQAVQWGRS